MSNKALGIIFGSTMHEKNVGPLTTERSIASLPFGGRYRLIDFTLSNMSNSGIYNVGIITHSNYQSLMQHVGSGKSWDMSRKIGGLRILPPSLDKVFNTRWEALRNMAYFVRNSDEKYVVLADGDVVCNFDFSKALAFHEDKLSDITVIYRKKDLGDGNDKNKLYFTIDNDSRVVGAARSDRVKGVQNVDTYMYIIGREFLLGLLENSEEKNISSFDGDVICRGVNDYRIYAYEHEGYFASVDSVANYFRHSMEMLDRNKCVMLFDNDGANIFTKVRDSAPCRFAVTSSVKNSIIADGCVIKGRVENSILFRGVKVAEDAVVKNSILFQDTEVGDGTFLNCVITDKNVHILDSRMLSGHETNPYIISKNTVI